MVKRLRLSLLVVFGLAAWLVAATACAQATPTPAPTPAPVMTPTPTPAVPSTPAVARPEGTATVLWHTALSPAWYDPAKTVALATPFYHMYIMQDNLIKPMPGTGRRTPRLAVSWTISDDWTEYEFKLRQGVKFHNGDPFTAEDVKFTLERYLKSTGVGASVLKERIASSEVVDPYTFRIKLKEPWVDFLDFYTGLTTGAAYILPKKYLEEVGDEGFAQHPIGLGAFKFVRFTPGVEMVYEAFEDYWDQVPDIKTLIVKGVPESATRFAMLKAGEADIIFFMTAEQATAAEQDPNLTLDTVVAPVSWWMDFVDQWDPQSPFNDIRVRQAVNYAVDRQAIVDAAWRGIPEVQGSIIPPSFEGYLPFDPYPYDPEKAKQLLKEAGYEDGFDVVVQAIAPFHSQVGEPIVSYLRAVGINATYNTLERAVYLEKYRGGELTGIVANATGAIGNAASRIASFVISSAGTMRNYEGAGYADIDELFAKYSAELDLKKREAYVHEIQQLMHDRVMFGPLFNIAFFFGVGPRLEETGIGLNPVYPPMILWERISLKR